MSSLLTSAIFIALALGLVALVYFGVRAACVRSGVTEVHSKTLALRTILCILIWLGVLASLALGGFFANFATIPPRILLAPITALIAVSILLTHGSVSPLILALPISWPIFLQSFRIVMELILWALYRQGIIPPQMTFSGLNIDIIVGLSAPLVGWMCIKPGRWTLYWARLWNLASLLILANIVFIALVSTPSRLRVFMNEPANTLIGTFPYIWLPGFIVPLAVFAHFVSLKQIRVRRQKLRSL